jgi:hypothetical protein
MIENYFTVFKLAVAVVLHRINLGFTHKIHLQKQLFRQSNFQLDVINSSKKHEFKIDCKC